MKSVSGKNVVVAASTDTLDEVEKNRNHPL